MRAHRPSRSSAADATRFVEEPAAKLLGGFLREQGYVLTPPARVFEWACGSRTVRLVRRQRASESRTVVLSIVLL